LCDAIIEVLQLSSIIVTLGDSIVNNTTHKQYILTAYSFNMGYYNA